MELERTGPLSYDLTVPDRDPSAQRGIVWGLLVTAAAWLVIIIGGWFTLGIVADDRIVHRWFPAGLVLAALVATYLGTRASTTRARRNGLLIVLAISCGAAVLAHNALANIKVAAPQIERAIDGIDLPPGYRLLDEERSGDRLCRQGCPRIDRTYTAPAGDPDPVRTLILEMFEQGWRPGNPDVEPVNSSTALRDGVYVQLAQKEDIVELIATRARV